MWWENDSAYRGNSLNDDFYFISPIISVRENIDAAILVCFNQ